MGPKAVVDRQLVEPPTELLFSSFRYLSFVSSTTQFSVFGKLDVTRVGLKWVSERTPRFIVVPGKIL